MKPIIEIIVMAIIIICIGGGLYEMMKLVSLKTDTIMVTYDCRLVNVSPDLPPKVIDECRKRMAK